MRKTLMSAAVAIALSASAVTHAQVDGRAGAAAAPRAGQSSGITTEQRARLSEKLRLIDQIMRAAEPDMQAQQMPAQSRQWMLEKLLKMPLEQVQAVGMPGGFAATSNAISKAVHLKAIGSGSTDLVYRPITPCRFIDTRNVGGPIVGSRTFDLDGAGDVNGGSASCNVVSASGINDADDMAGIAINVAIVSPTTAPGFIGARPPGSSNTTALVNWYEAGPQVQASNAGVIPTFQGTGNEIEFFGSPTQIVVDVFGVFTRPGATALGCSTVTALITVPNGTFHEIQTGACPAGKTITGGSCGWQNAGIGVTGLSKTINSSELIGTNTWLCGGANNAGADRDLVAMAICCQVPGR